MTNTTAPAFTHSLSCEEQRIGQVVLGLIESGLTELGVDQILFAFEHSYQTPRSCDCGQRALRVANEELRLARKQRDAYNADAGRLFVADPAYVNALEFRVLDLKGRRDALKAELA